MITTLQKIITLNFINKITKLKNISRIKDNKISKILMTNYRENRQHTYISTSNTLAIILPE